MHRNNKLGRYSVLHFPQGLRGAGAALCPFPLSSRQAKHPTHYKIHEKYMKHNRGNISLSLQVKISSFALKGEKIPPSLHKTNGSQRDNDK